MKIRNVLKWGLAAWLCAVGVLSLQAQNITKPKIACPNGLWVNSYNGVLFYPDRCGDEEYGTADLASVLLQQFV